MTSKIHPRIDWQTVRSILFSWDFMIAILIAIIAFWLLPCKVANDLARDVYNVGITSLSIIFSVYFAALAIIISSGDNDFIDFFDEQGDYTRLIKSFRYALLALLLALLLSIFLYTAATVLFYGKHPDQPKFIMVVFSFFSSYGLLATFMAANDSIKYALYRVKFLRLKRLRKQHGESNDLQNTEDSI
jgi:hypothetical protein